MNRSRSGIRWVAARAWAWVARAVWVGETTVCEIWCSMADDGVALLGPAAAVAGPAVRKDGDSALFPLLVELRLRVEFAADLAGRVVVSGRECTGT